MCNKVTDKTYDCTDEIYLKHIIKVLIENEITVLGQEKAKISLYSDALTGFARSRVLKWVAFNLSRTMNFDVIIKLIIDDSEISDSNNYKGYDNH